VFAPVTVEFQLTKSVDPGTRPPTQLLVKLRASVLFALLIVAAYAQASDNIMTLADTAALRRENFAFISLEKMGSSEERNEKPRINPTAFYKKNLICMTQSLERTRIQRTSSVIP
jgi:hypothetical protein